MENKPKVLLHKVQKEQETMRLKCQQMEVAEVLLRLEETQLKMNKMMNEARLIYKIESVLDNHDFIKDNIQQIILIYFFESLIFYKIRFNNNI